VIAPAEICPHCRARIDPRGDTVVMAGFLPALDVPLGASNELDAPRVAVFPVAAAGAITIPFVFARFRRFEPAGDCRGRLAR